MLVQKSSLLAIVILILVWNGDCKGLHWKNIYHEVTVIMNEVTFMLFLKKFVICCEKNFFIHLCTDGWQLKFFANMT